MITYSGLFYLHVINEKLLSFVPFLKFPFFLFAQSCLWTTNRKLSYINVQCMLTHLTLQDAESQQKFILNVLGQKSSCWLLVEWIRMRCFTENATIVPNYYYFCFVCIRLWIELAAVNYCHCRTHLCFSYSPQKLLGCQQWTATLVWWRSISWYFLAFNAWEYMS